MKIAPNAHAEPGSAISSERSARAGAFDAPVSPGEVNPQSGSVPAAQARRGILFVLVSAVAFGAMPIFAKLAYSAGMDLKTLLALRFSLAAAGMWLLWGWIARRGGKTPGLKAIPPLIIMGAVGYVGQSFAYFTAVSLMSASATGLLLYTYPAVVTLLAWAVYRERMTGPKLAALGLCTLGTLMVLGIFSLGGSGEVGALNPQGVFWGLAASAFYSAYIIAGTRFTANVDPIFSSAVIITSAAAVYIAWGGLAGELQGGFDPVAILWAVAIAILSTIVAIAAFFVGLGIVGPSRASIVSTVEPAVTVGLAALVLGDHISPGQLLGGALILSAVLVVQWRARQPRPALQQPHTEPE